MAGFCKVFLLGNCGQEPQTKVFDNGDSITNFSLATSDQWTDKSGEKRESTEWFSCVAYRQLAKIAADFIKKGSKVFVEGRIKTRSWEKEGVKQYRTEVEVLKLLVLDKRGEISEPSASTDIPF
jgi:single-strand DNA-binding protein